MAREELFRTCIVCPRGCRLRIRRRGGEIEVEGNECPRGVEHGIREATDPRRLVTTTVRTSFARSPRLAVRSSAEVPLQEIPRLMRLTDGVLIDRPVSCGELLRAELFGPGIHLVATDEIAEGSAERCSTEEG